MTSPGDTIRRAAVESGHHLVKRGNMYISLGLVITIITATVYITREVEKMRHSIEWNTRQVSEMLLRRDTITELRVRLARLEAKVEAAEHH